MDSSPPASEPSTPTPVSEPDADATQAPDPAAVDTVEGDSGAVAVEDADTAADVDPAEDADTAADVDPAEDADTAQDVEPAENADVDAGPPDTIEPNPEALDPTPAPAPAAPAAEGADATPAAKPKPAKRPPAGPDPAEVVRRVGSTSAAALRYVLAPEPKLSRLSRKIRETLITDVPPVTAGALLGPDALARHLVASAATGRYRDLFVLWELFRARPDACKPVLAERQRALERARRTLTTAVRIGLRGRADRVAADVTQAQGLIWTWLREALMGELAAVGRRPQIAAALLAREPGLKIPLPESPGDDWLAEAAAVKAAGALPPALDTLLAAGVDRLPPSEATLSLVASSYPDRLPTLIDRLPATVATLSLVAERHPQRLPDLVDRIDLGGELGPMLAWARDHGVSDRLRERIQARVEAAGGDRAAGLAEWRRWRDQGVDVPLPAQLRSPDIAGLDLARPESAELIATLVADGADIRPQVVLDELAERNRQLAEKAYEAFVCADLDVHLPLALEGNPIVRDGTRCPACQAWTWVRPGHEQRCPRRRREESAIG